MEADQRRTSKKSNPVSFELLSQYEPAEYLKLCGEFQSRGFAIIDFSSSSLSSSYLGSLSEFASSVAEFFSQPAATKLQYKLGEREIGYSVHEGVKEAFMIKLPTTERGQKFPNELLQSTSIAFFRMMDNIARTILRNLELGFQKLQPASHKGSWMSLLDPDQLPAGQISSSVLRAFQYFPLDQAKKSNYACDDHQDLGYQLWQALRSTHLEMVDGLKRKRKQNKDN